MDLTRVEERLSQLRHLVRLPGIRTGTTAPQEPSRRHAADARATPVRSRVRRGPPIQKVDLTGVEKKIASIKAFSQATRR